MYSPKPWNEECFIRERVNEGVRNAVYNDSLGVPTIGIGFNLARGDGPEAMKLIGADYQQVLDGAPLSDTQVEMLFHYSWGPIESEARASLDESHFDTMSDARRFVLCDLVFNLGEGGWDSFQQTRARINTACHLARTGNPTAAHRYFGLAAEALVVSAWASEVGDRAKRDIAMLRTSNWCSPIGDGSDAS